ncbi:probable serine/threonine-protein kinase At1g54610 isoform X1 [Ananas comosus]|uniref:[RNA-polymerase]-subunit kinase n=1 Tax=Ananas comosus TaxID=4615 RepID=A0A6P5FG43_ANACO|nr:probable serine/threonine-protein kinase At1g54610 isoform X1 [Ananas comosus]
MGCVASKKEAPVTPAAIDSSGPSGEIVAESGSLWNRPPRIGNDESFGDRRSESGESGKVSSNGASSTSFRLRNLHKYLEGEQLAAGWPGWLTAVAGEAIRGWVPLKADSFEKLEKIGQGTYSSVFRARELDTGRIVALKKVRFDNFEPGSVRFMAREIQILRRLDHPNIVKLEGLITSRLSCSIYLVFEYMEHDLAGLSSSPDIKFSEPQIKCYMHQLLSGLEHCHSRGVMHRDIKCANLLVNNEGILKMADFGLANCFTLGQKQPLTSRVVTLWYRPPELLFGSTDYQASVDLWSVGCVFAEMFVGKPILQGRTEIEQIHKIFKLCGSPPDEYWRKSKLSYAAVFKPQQRYENCLRETFKFLPECAFGLLRSLLSVEPYKRGTASTALTSEYFTTKPYALDPSSLPKYPPNKEIDAKVREEAQRRRVSSRPQGPEEARRPSRTFRTSHEQHRSSHKVSHQEESTHEDGKIAARRDHHKVNGETRLFVDLQPLPTINPHDGTRSVKQLSQEDNPFSGPLQISASTGFAWATKKPKEELSCAKPQIRVSSRKHATAVEPLSVSQAEDNTTNMKGQPNGTVRNAAFAGSKSSKSYEVAKEAMMKQWAQVEVPDPFDSSNAYRCRDSSEEKYKRDTVSFKSGILSYKNQEDRVEFSGPLLSQSCKVDELLQKHERQIRQAVRRSWFQKGRK